MQSLFMKSYNSTNISEENPLLLGDCYLTSIIMITLIMLANCDLSHKNCCWHHKFLGDNSGAIID
jgi:hypothetical protein